MTEVVTVELRDELYAVLKQQAESVGISLAEWIAVGLKQQNSLLIQPKTEAEKEVARQRFRRDRDANYFATFLVRSSC
jgi:hypothetical protein